MGALPDVSEMANAVQPKDRSFHQDRRSASPETQSFMMVDSALAVCIRAPLEYDEKHELNRCS